MLYQLSYLAWNSPVQGISRIRDEMGEFMDEQQQELWERIEDVRPTVMTTLEEDGDDPGIH